MKHQIKFTDHTKETLLLDNIFAVDEYLEYATKHRMDVLFTETTSTSSVDDIYKFIKNGYTPLFREAKQVAPDGTVLSPKIHVLLWRMKNATLDR